MDDPILRKMLIEAVLEDYEDGNDGSALEALIECLEAVGYDCPFCGSGCIDVINNAKVVENAVRHDCACRMCDEDWTECYDVTGYLYG